MLSVENQALLVQRRNDRLPDTYGPVVIGALGALSDSTEEDSVEFTPIARVFLE
ncbi:hypothetical protein [Nocardia asiatica]|uniref:hypothetical protein n=1 Tax=Nocardia asiatica TaxID=209252 RepID=UPI002458BC80|nr:hypothetical protein [Nocardia asiatica]